MSSVSILNKTKTKYKNMDYRLDFYNALEKFEKQMTEDDALFIISHNCKEGDLILGINGDFSIISSVLANENGYVNIEDKKKKLNYEKTQSMILNIAINILRVDENLRKKFSLAIELL